MNKLKQLEALVEEAMVKITTSGFIDLRKILIDLANKSAEIGDGELPLQPLPEQIPEWFMWKWNTVTSDFTEQKSRIEEWNKVIRHFGTKPREWWMDLKKGDKFINPYGIVFEFDSIGLRTKHTFYLLSDCSPYTDPTQSFRDKLSPELQQEFDKLTIK